MFFFIIVHLKTISYNNFILDFLADKEFDGEHKWIKCNRDFTGLYLIDYSSNLASQLSDHLNSDEKRVWSIKIMMREEEFLVFFLIFISYLKLLTSHDRANLIHDSFVLSFLDKYSNSYQTAFDLSNYITKYEFDYLPWKVYANQMNRLGNLLEQHSFYPLSVSWIQNYSLCLSLILKF